jgi:hypothetical protein
MKAMKRLCQLGMFLLLLATFLMPLAELFDSWDTAGIANDTEFATLMLVLTFALILAVCAMVVQFAFLIRLASSLMPDGPDQPSRHGRTDWFTPVLPPLLLTPLRI